MDKQAPPWLIIASIALSIASRGSMAGDLPVYSAAVQLDWNSQPSEASDRPGYSPQSPARAREPVRAVNPVRMRYNRSAPSADAASQAGDPEPTLGAAHELSLALELSTEPTRQQQAALHLYGPWLTSDGLSHNAQQLIRAIQNTSVHGLNPDSYSLAQILRTVDTLTHMDKPTTHAGRTRHSVMLPGSTYLRETFNQLMDKAFVQLVTHLGQGVVDARITQRELYRDVPIVHADALLEAVHEGRSSAIQALNAVTPTHAEYQRLTTRMRNLLTERATGIERLPIGDQQTLRADMTHPAIMDVKFRLIETGELPDITRITPYFDSTLTVALKKFQQRNGLVMSGIVDEATRKALEFSIDEEIEAISLSLERWRWMPRELGEKHLFINIPSYHVEYRDGPETRLSMVAVVGAVEHQTPSFTRDMTYMEFNPTWTVPSTITNKELIPKERRNPGYLESRDFEYLKRTGNQLIPVPAAQVSKADFQQASFPYVLRQRGGPRNALGRMKFLMPNPYAIYLHDTQAKKHFTLNDRAFSHGCIRLSNPEQLATVLMQADGYDPAYIEQVLASRDTTRVRFRSPIPTHITYLTSWVDEEGRLQRRADIYEHDAALKIALQASDTLLSVLQSGMAAVN